MSLKSSSCLILVFFIVCLFNKERAEEQSHSSISTTPPPPLLSSPLLSLSGLCSQQNRLVLCSIESGKINDCRVGVGRSSCVWTCMCAQCFCLSGLMDQSCQLSDIYRRARPRCCICAGVAGGYVNVSVVCICIWFLFLYSCVKGQSTFKLVFVIRNPIQDYLCYCWFNVELYKCLHFITPIIPEFHW